MARDGFPTMALTACFGSPLFVLLGGLSCSLFFAAADGRSRQVELPADLSILVLYSSSVLVSGLWLFFIPLVFKYTLTNWTVAMGFTMYICFLLAYCSSQ